MDKKGWVLVRDSRKLRMSYFTIGLVTLVYGIIFFRVDEGMLLDATDKWAMFLLGVLGIYAGANVVQKFTAGGTTPTIASPPSETEVPNLEDKKPIVEVKNPSIVVPKNLGLRNNNWPRYGTPEFTEYYGTIDEAPDRLVRVDFPFDHVIAWDQSQVAKSTLIHENVSDSYLRCLKAAVDHYGIERIEELRLNIWGGVYNKRKMRGGDDWSTHSWAIAEDRDPDYNQMSWNDTKSTFAGSDYKAWFEIWEAEGWLSLGRARNKDWMHIQACGL